MNGKTIKKIRKFVDILIANTPKEQINKTREQMIEEMKSEWHSKGKAGHDFIDYIIKNNKKGS